MLFFVSESRNSDDSSGSFSSIFSAISDAGRASVNALMGASNTQAHHRTSKSRRKMTGFDVKRLGMGDGQVTTPRGMRATPTHFSDLVDILHNGQRQGVLVFRSGSGIAISSPRPDLSASFTPSSATERAFFSDPVPSPFPFDRKVHQRQGFLNRPRPQNVVATPSSFAAPPTTTTLTSSFSNSFQPNQPLTFTGGVNSNFASSPSAFSFPSATPISTTTQRFPEETTINQLINNLGQQSGIAAQVGNFAAAS